MNCDQASCNLLPTWWFLLMSWILMIKIDPLDIPFLQNSLMDRNTHMRAQRWFYSFCFQHMCNKDIFNFLCSFCPLMHYQRALISFFFKWDKKNICFGLDLNYAHLDNYPKSSYLFISIFNKDFVILCEARTFSSFC